MAQAASEGSPVAPLRRLRRPRRRSLSSPEREEPSSALAAGPSPAYPSASPPAARAATGSSAAAAAAAPSSSHAGDPGVPPFFAPAELCSRHVRERRLFRARVLQSLTAARSCGWTYGDVQRLREVLRSQLQEDVFRRRFREQSDALAGDAAKRGQLFLELLTEVHSATLKELMEEQDEAVDWMCIATKMAVDFGTLAKVSYGPASCRINYLHRIARRTGNHFTEKQTKALAMASRASRGFDWEKVAEKVGSNRSSWQCFRRYHELHASQAAPWRWSAAADQRLDAVCLELGTRDWECIAARFGDGPDAESCRRRWAERVAAAELLPAQDGVVDKQAAETAACLTTAPRSDETPQVVVCLEKTQLKGVGDADGKGHGPKDNEVEGFIKRGRRSVSRTRMGSDSDSGGARSRRGHRRKRKIEDADAGTGERKLRRSSSGRMRLPRRGTSCARCRQAPCLSGGTVCLPCGTKLLAMDVDRACARLPSAVA